MVDRALTKELIGAEDILWGTGSVNQNRASGEIPITRIDANQIPYENSQTLRAKLGLKIETVATIAALQVLPTSTAEEKYVNVLGYYNAGDGGGGLFYLDTSDTTSPQDESIIFNPDVPANGRWKRLVTDKQLSGDIGDADAAIATVGPGITIANTPLTTARTVALPSSGLYRGLTKTLLRTAAATGGAGLVLSDGTTITTLAVSEKATATYDGTAWVLTSKETVTA